MNPLALLQGKQRLSGDELINNQIIPLMHKRLLLEGKADNDIIDALFDLSLRCQAIGAVNNNKPVYNLGVKAHEALIKSCDVAATHGKMSICPSTDQLKSICRCLDAMHALASTITRKTYLTAVFTAQEILQNNIKKVDSV